MGRARLERRRKQAADGIGSSGSCGSPRPPARRRRTQPAAGPRASAVAACGTSLGAWHHRADSSGRDPGGRRSKKKSGRCVVRFSIGVDGNRVPARPWDRVRGSRRCGATDGCVVLGVRYRGSAPRRASGRPIIPSPGGSRTKRQGVVPSFQDPAGRPVRWGTSVPGWGGRRWRCWCPLVQQGAEGA